MAITLISTVTVGAGGAASISFSSIPGTYTDLQIVLSGRSDYAGTAIYCNIQPNGTMANASFRDLYGTGSAVGSRSGTPSSAAPVMSGASATANTFGSINWYIPNYAGTTTYKSISSDSVSETNATGGFQAIVAILNSSNSAITSLTLAPDLGNFVQYSTASLYGITKGSSGGVTVS